MKVELYLTQEIHPSQLYTAEVMDLRGTNREILICITNFTIKREGEKSVRCNK